MAGDVITTGTAAADAAPADAPQETVSVTAEQTEATASDVSGPRAADRAPQDAQKTAPAQPETDQAQAPGQAPAQAAEHAAHRLRWIQPPGATGLTRPAPAGPGPRASPLTPPPAPESGAGCPGSARSAPPT